MFYLQLLLFKYLLIYDMSMTKEDPLSMFREEAKFPEFPVQKYLLEEKLSRARQLATEHFLSIQTDAHVPFQRFQEFLNAEELTVRDTNKEALYEVVLSKLQTLTLHESRSQHVTDAAFSTFEGQYNEAKTWFCDMYPGFEMCWSEAVLQNWVSKAGVDVHLAEETEAYLAAIGSREVPMLLKALDEQRSELLIQKHVRKRLVDQNWKLIHSIFKLSFPGPNSEQILDEAHQLVRQIIKELSE